MTSPRVTVIIVSYNRLTELRRAIDSALAQTLTDREILVIDNCSSFDAVEALADYGDRIRVMRNTGNYGCGNARNVAVKEARGEFVAFLDDDDAWREDKLEKQLAAIGDKLMCTSGMAFYPNGQPGGRIDVRPITQVTPIMLRRGNKICGPSGFFCRRSLFDRVWFDESIKFAEDWDFLIRVLAIGEIAYVPEPLVLYTVNTSGGSMTSVVRQMSWGQMQYRFVVTDKHRAFLGEFHYHRRIAKDALAHIASRPDKATFIRHSIDKAGPVATGVALGEGFGRKLGKMMRRLVRA